MAKFYIGNYAATLRGALSGGALSLSVDGQDAELVDGTGGGGIWPWPGTERQAASASLADVQAAVNAASDGDWVSIPNTSPTVTWSGGISTTKQIGIVAQNYTPTPGGTMTRNVTIINATPDNGSGTALFQFTSGNSYHVGLGGIRFDEVAMSATSVSRGPHVRFLGGGSKVPLLFDVAMQNTQRNGVAYDVASVSWECRGGVMWNCYISGEGVVGGTGYIGSLGVNILIGGSTSDGLLDWESGPTWGTLDTGGVNNTYIEDCTFYICGMAPDVENHGRCVLRYSTIDGCPADMHGLTSFRGGRQFESYNNNYVNTVTGRNHTKYFWCRGGTCLLTDNFASDNDTVSGTPDIFDVGDFSPPSGSYLIPRQPGCGHDGTNYVSDPIYIWNNTGGAGSRWTYNGTGWNAVVQVGRDLFIDAGAKPGYTKYTYPHPARAGVDAGQP